MIELRPATAIDWISLFGSPPPMRLRAVTALVDGAPAAIGGLAYEVDGTPRAFLQGHTIAQRFPVAVHKAVKAGLAEARARGVRCIVAECDANVEAAARWLARLGFEPTPQPGIWVWRV